MQTPKCVVPKLVTGARSGVTVLRTALRCQKTHLKIKRFLGVGGARPYSGWRKSSHWCIIADFIPTNVASGMRLYSALNFVCVCLSFGQFQMVVVTPSCLLPQTRLHRSCTIIRVIAIFVRGMFDITATNCRPRWRLSPIHHTYLFSANLKIWAEKWCKSNVGWFYIKA